MVRDWSWCGVIRLRILNEKEMLEVAVHMRKDMIGAWDLGLPGMCAWWTLWYH